ncbi:baseplate wedge subunit [Klebsiella phage CPRSA]|nr:baseplate wedge subunit [Klebsiella phage CPRSA]
MDVLNDRLYVLVTGEVKTAMMDPTVKANVIPSNDAGVYLWMRMQRRLPCLW